MSERPLKLTVCVRKANNAGTYGALASALDKTTNERLTMQPFVGSAPRSGVAALKALVEFLVKIPDASLDTVGINDTFPVDGLTRWIHKWKLNGWVTNDGTTVKLRAAWEKAEAELSRTGGVLQYVPLPQIVEEVGGEFVGLVADAANGLIVMDDIDSGQLHKVSVPDPPSFEMPAIRLPGQGMF